MGQIEYKSSQTLDLALILSMNIKWGLTFLRGVHFLYIFSNQPPDLHQLFIMPRRPDRCLDRSRDQNGALWLVRSIWEVYSPSLYYLSEVWGQLILRILYKIPTARLSFLRSSKMWCFHRKFWSIINPRYLIFLGLKNSFPTKFQSKTIFWVFPCRSKDKKLHFIHIEG